MKVEKQRRIRLPVINEKLEEYKANYGFALCQYKFDIGAYELRNIRLPENYEELEFSMGANHIKFGVFAQLIEEGKSLCLNLDSEFFAHPCGRELGKNCEKYVGYPNRKTSEAVDLQKIISHLERNELNGVAISGKVASFSDLGNPGISAAVLGDGEGRNNLVRRTLLMYYKQVQDS